MNEVSDATLAPLNASEARRAIAAARRYLEPELTHEGQSRYRVLGAELSLTRPRDKDALVRRDIEVLVVDYLGRRQVRVVVERGRVVEVRELTGPAAFSADEIAEAEAIALEVPRLKAIASRESVFSSPFAAGGCDVRSRRIGLRFMLARPDRPALPLASAEVDLIEQRLVSYDVNAAGELVAGTEGTYGSVR